MFINAIFIIHAITIIVTRHRRHVKGDNAVKTCRHISNLASPPVNLTRTNLVFVSPLSETASLVYCVLPPQSITSTASGFKRFFF